MTTPWDCRIAAQQSTRRHLMDAPPVETVSGLPMPSSNTLRLSAVTHAVKYVAAQHDNEYEGVYRKPAVVDSVVFAARTPRWEPAGRRRRSRESPAFAADSP